MDGELRRALVLLVRHKFRGTPNVASLAEDIVQDAYARLNEERQYSRHDFYILTNFSFMIQYVCVVYC